MVTLSNDHLTALRVGLKKMVLSECNVKGVVPSQLMDDQPIIGATAGPLSLDSLDAVEIVAALERNFGLRLENAGAAREVVKSFVAMSDFVLQNGSQERIDNFVEREGRLQ